MAAVELLYKTEVYEIIGAALDVYNTLGPGFLEAVYQEALEYELGKRKIPFTAQQQLRIYYDDHPLNSTYKADFLIYSNIIVEIKAINQLTSIEEAQLINYLKASKLQLGMLINFGAKDKLQWKRRVNTK